MPPTQKMITHSLLSATNLLPEKQMLDSAPNEIRRLNRLRLKVKCTPFPKNRPSVQYSPKSPARRFFGSSGSSPAPSPLSPSFSIDALKNSLRPDKQRSAQHSQPDAIEVEIRVRAADSRESIASSLSASCSYEPGQSMIVKDVPAVAEAATGWQKLPPRLPIPKWDVDD
ncbi:uncharacterized protein BJ212DRAFT_1303700 [Suillus subaureus]|uniref:Uncharacterized protein n=1 Tax=Suillus subaureus TaxID=48587 RepID=A0A9P7DXZ8_9AGAM|nr:uncharacterized protein BJ212DRAFT_1303700 [Suillus subaureus]KAG1806175.1 hypothetical protein BJ212DRAFT_1303700 [Suillus subaureus]